MNDDHETEWPSFEMVLRDVAPEREPLTEVSLLEAPVLKEVVLDEVSLEEEPSFIEESSFIDAPMDAGSFVDSVKLDVVADSNFESEDLLVDELDEYVLDLDDPAPGDLVVDPELAASTNFIESTTPEPEPELELESVSEPPPPPLAATQILKPEPPAPQVVASTPMIESEDAGWVSHSLHNAQEPTLVPDIFSEISGKVEPIDIEGPQVEADVIELRPRVDSLFSPDPVEETSLFAPVDQEIVWTDAAESPAPADLLIDFEDLAPKHAAPSPVGVPLESIDAELEPPTRLPTMFAVPDDVEPAVATDPETDLGFDPGIFGANLFDQVPAPTVPAATVPAPPVGGQQPTTPTGHEIAPPARAEDPWAYMRPEDEVDEKITFWANRPKFFGGDERRIARAKREADERRNNK